MGTAIAMWRYGTLVAILWTCLAASSVSCDGGGRDAHTVKQLLGQEYANAKCLDGTPGAYYANVNTKVNGTWVIYLNGGGECVDENQCAARAKTKLGSSKLMDDELWMNYGVLDTNESTNPQFYEANFVRIGYCSGDLYLGSRQEPDDSGLLFQGRFIVHGVLDDLQNKYGFLDTADTIVFGGESAGGIGSLALMDEVASSLKLMGSKARFFGSIQGGYYFLNDRVYQGTHPKPGNYIPWGTDAFPKYVEYWGAEDGLPKACVDANPQEPWRCIVADFSFPHVETPVFVAEALTDKTVLPLHTGMPGTPPLTQDEREYTYYWSMEMSTSIQRNVLRRPAGPGLFAIACWTHTSFEEGRMIKQTTHLDALSRWMAGEDVRLLDPCGTMLCNPTCPPTTSRPEH